MSGEVEKSGVGAGVLAEEAVLQENQASIVNGPMAGNTQEQVEKPVDEAETLIRVRNLGKAYQTFSRPEDRLKQFLFPGRKYYKESWALRGVDLDIKRGETVGIIGRNGSGKSTLLQMICGTLTPSEGTMEVRGRIAALLELGSGFNPEFSGHDNVMLNGQILGMNRKEMEERYERIVGFADIGAYINRPVKTYSSGMYTRLAFSVAIHVEPDILVVDEALSVGDEAFQRKCFGRIEQIRAGGATVLFVSHGAGTIIELCDRAVLLDQGRRLLTGRPKTVVSWYQKLAYSSAEKGALIRKDIERLDASGEANAEVEMTSSATAREQANNPDTDALSHFDPAHFDPGVVSQSVIEYSQNGAEISDIRIVTPQGKAVNVLQPGNVYHYLYKVTFHRAATLVRCGMLIKTTLGTELGGLATHPQGEGEAFVKAGTVWEVTLPFVCRLTPGHYFLNAGLVGAGEEGFTFLHRVLDAVMIRVLPEGESVVTGVVDFSAEIPPTYAEVGKEAGVVEAV